MGLFWEVHALGRPIGVSIMAIVAAINGVVYTIAGAGNLLNVNVPWIAEIQQEQQTGGLAMLIVGLGWLLLTWGFWTGQRWARLLGVIWAGLSIVAAAWVLVTHLDVLSTILVPVIVGAAVPLIIFWYLRTDQVRAFFAR